MSLEFAVGNPPAGGPFGRRVTQAEEDRIRELAIIGYPISVIANEVGFGETSVRRVIAAPQK